MPHALNELIIATLPRPWNMYQQQEAQMVLGLPGIVPLLIVIVLGVYVRLPHRGQGRLILPEKSSVQ